MNARNVAMFNFLFPPGSKVPSSNAESPALSRKEDIAAPGESQELTIRPAAGSVKKDRISTSRVLEARTKRPCPRIGKSP